LTADAQEYRATLTGFVNDPQGLALPGGTVTATHVDTGHSARLRDVLGAVQ
jgi:hypothetical protein